MHHASSSIGALAAALAKAQAELVNPEKSLVGAIARSKPGAPERTFRYAPLSSGLDIIRKTLGQYEIATIQTTNIDDESGIIRLTTVLAHASGEWMSSDWPVCPVSETGTPHRLGAALTYARRYALFTLVGIAGEDDIDAPDLPVAGEQVQRAPSPLRDANGASTASAATTAPKRGSRSPLPILDIAQSADLRKQLEGQLGGVNTTEELTAWAARILATRNTLTSVDALALERAFEARLNSVQSPTPEPRDQQIRLDAAGGMSANGHEMADERLALPKTSRRRDKRHLRFVSTQPCVVCGRTPSDAHHLRFAEPRALGCKVSDEFTVPLCRSHHRALHEAGDERAWWHDTAIDPLPIARNLWSERRGSTAL